MMNVKKAQDLRPKDDDLSLDDVNCGTVLDKLDCVSELSKAVHQLYSLEWKAEP